MLQIYKKKCNIATGDQLFGSIVWVRAAAWLSVHNAATALGTAIYLKSFYIVLVCMDV